MRNRFLLIAAFAFVFSLHAQAQEKPFVEGSWQPRAMAKDEFWRERATHDNGEAAWKISPSALRLNIPAGEPGDYEIAREESLPDGDWTLDFALVYRGRSSSGIKVAFFAGVPGEEFTLRLEHGDGMNGPDVLSWSKGNRTAMRSRWDPQGVSGPVQWVKILYSPLQKRMAIWVNGVPITLDKTAFVLIPRGPVGFRVSSTYRSDEENSLEIAAFHGQNTAKWEPDSIAGIAFKGWPQAALAAPLNEQISTRAQTALEAPDADANTRVNALLALLMSERAATGKLSDESWEKLAAFVNKSIDLDLSSLSRLLPIAVACADVEKNPARRAKAETWLRRAFEGLPAPHQDRWDTNNILQRLALLDPARASDAVVWRRLSLRAARALANDLKAAAPLKAFAAYRTFERPFPDAEAWLLPETGALSSLWGRVMSERLRATATEKSFVMGQPDQALRAAAYRMAGVDSVLAMEFVGLIQKPDIKAEALEVMEGVLPPGGANADVDRAVVLALEAVIAQWKPSARDDSNAPQKIRLAQWHFTRGRAAEANRILTEAQANLGKLPRTRFRDSWAMARALRDMKSPDAKLWLDKAAENAVAVDKDADEYGGGLYLSATVIVVSGLVQSGQIEDALVILRKLDRDDLDDNFNLGLARVIFALTKNNARRDMARALKLAEELSPGNQRENVMGHLAGVLAATDLATARALWEELDAANQLGPAFKILAVALPEKAGEWRALAGQSIAAHLRQWKTARNHGTHKKLTDNLDALPVGVLLELEPHFADDRAFFFAALSAAIARDAGWDQTPLWKRYVAAENEGGWSVPWGLGHLSDSIRAEESNRE